MTNFLMKKKAVLKKQRKSPTTHSANLQLLNPRTFQGDQHQAKTQSTRRNMSTRREDEEEEEKKHFDMS